jgi:hypothetical protein
MSTSPCVADKAQHKPPDCSGKIDIEHCPNCGGALKIIAPSSLRTGIENPPVIVKILSHLGLPTRAPGSSSRFIPDHLTAEYRLRTPAPTAPLALSLTERRHKELSRGSDLLRCPSRPEATLEF